jgi:hypothetical protein
MGRSPARFRPVKGKTTMKTSYQNNEVKTMAKLIEQYESAKDQYFHAVRMYGKKSKQVKDLDAEVLRLRTQILNYRG